MKKSRFSDAQILAKLKQGEAGIAVADICREHGVSNATYYNSRSKYGGITIQSWVSPNLQETLSTLVKQVHISMKVMARVD